MRLAGRFVGVLTAAGGAAALGVAYFAQYVLLLMPCELCLWERWPYRIVIGLGVLAALFGSRFILAAAVLVLLAGAAIAGLHVGVEWHFWASPLPECNGMLTPGAALPAMPARPCDEPVFLIPHLPVSMAMMDLLFAVAFAVAIAAYLVKQQRRII